jgi:hypothetical protein
VSSAGGSDASDRQLAALADRQHGVFATWQLTDDSCGRHAIEHRASTKRLRRLHRGVYAYGHRRLTANGYRLAAALACGPTAVVSHRSAAAIWELIQTSPTRIDITVPGTSRCSRRGIRVHRARRLRPEDVTTVDGVPVTTVAQTLLDLAAVVNRTRLRRAIEQADRSGVLNLDALLRAIDRAPTRKGTANLRSILADYAGPALTRSGLERRFLELVEEAGLPKPLVNVKVAGFEVDVFWPQWRLVVELDSRAFHLDPRTFERDRLRDARLQRARCRVLRITDRRITASPKAVIADIRALAVLAA